MSCIHSFRGIGVSHFLFDFHLLSTLSLPRRHRIRFLSQLRQEDPLPIPPVAFTVFLYYEANRQAHPSDASGP